MPQQVMQRLLGRETLPLLLRVGAFTVVYLFCAWLGKELSVAETLNVSFWLPAGVYLAVLLLNPRPAWLWLALGALVANFTFDYLQGTPPAMILLFWLGNTLQATLGAWLLQRFVAREFTLTTLKQFAGLVGFAAVGSTMLGALVGAGTLVYFGVSDSFQDSWAVWWGSCAMPVLVLTPFILVWFSKAGRHEVVKVPARRIPEAVALLVIVLFSVNHIMKQGGVMAPYKIWLVPLLLYAGTRFGLHGATAATVLVALLVACLNSLYGQDAAFVEVGSGREAFVLQTTLAAIAVVGLVPAIVLGERTRALEALRDSEERFSKAFHSSPDAVVISDLETGCCEDANENFYRLYGLTPDETIGRTGVELGLWRDTDERALVAHRLMASGSLRNVERSGTSRQGRFFTVKVNAELFELRGRRKVVTTLHDITEQRQAELELRSAQAQELRAREEFARKLIEAQEGERHRIAAELHDSLGQNLSVIKSRAHLAREVVGDLPVVAGHLEAIERVVGTAIAETRSLSHNLRPPHIDEVGLTESLRALIAEVAQAGKARVEDRLENVDELFKGSNATHFFRIVQEALNNLVKHSQATQVTITLVRDVRCVRLRIADNGVGFSPAPSGGKAGLGLTSMRERARILGGSLTISSQPSQGTNLVLEVPLSENEPERIWS